MSNIISDICSCRPRVSKAPGAIRLIGRGLTIPRRFEHGSIGDGEPCKNALHVYCDGSGRDLELRCDFFVRQLFPE